MGKRKEAVAPLSRWQYFFKTLYYNAANTSEFTYNNRVYVKSEALQAVEQRGARVHYVLLLLLIAMFLLTSQYQNVWFVVIYLLAVVAGETARYLMLPRDIRSHLTDTGRTAKR